MTHDDLDFPPPSEEEIRESERLREALEDPSNANEGAELLRAVKSAAAPKALDPSELEARVERSLASPSGARRGVVIRVAFGATALAVAAAAAVIFALGHGPAAKAPELARARSTQPLFRNFDMHGGESARIDRILVARSADLRENQFARWGVSGGRR